MFENDFENLNYQNVNEIEISERLVQSVDLLANPYILNSQSEQHDISLKRFRLNFSFNFIFMFII